MRSFIRTKTYVCLYIAHVVHCSLCNGITMTHTSFPVLFLYQIAASLLRVIYIFVIYAFICNGPKFLINILYSMIFLRQFPAISRHEIKWRILKFSRDISHAYLLLTIGKGLTADQGFVDKLWPTLWLLPRYFFVNLINAFNRWRIHFKTRNFQILVYYDIAIRY